MSDIAKGITDCLDTINKLRDENTAQAARIAELETEKLAFASAYMKAGGELGTMQHRIARQRRTLAKLYQHRHEKNKSQAARIAKLEAALEKQSAEIIRLRASIEKIARWYEDQAAYYEAQEQAFNRPLGDYGAAARFAQAKFQHRQQAAEIRAAAQAGGKDD